MTRKCPGCGSHGREVFYEVAGVPANSGGLSASRDEAISLRRGDIALAFCRRCGLVFNRVFDPALVEGTAFDGDHGASSVYRAFEQRLAQQLIERYRLHGKEILDLGCGRGEFLALLCELGANHGRRLDADHVADPCRSLIGPDATVRYLPSTERSPFRPFDLICSKMLLEHIAEPARFLRSLQGALTLRKDARLFLQVSDFIRTLRNFAFWEIHYLHCSYFSPGTLDRLLRAQGFRVGEIWTDFDGQYLMADGRAGSDSDPDFQPRGTVETIADLAALVNRFAQEHREKQAMWCEILHRLAGSGNRIVIWGAEPEAASFLTTLAVGDEVSFVVDADPGRQGRYTPGTGHRVVPPEAMATTPPDVVIVMNPLLTYEIRDAFAEAGCTPTLLIA